MAEHNETGKTGEKLALEFLQEKCWNILEQNWRSGHKEVDIIAESDGKLIIVEVKVRKSIGGERIEEHINRSKQRHLHRAAAAYLKYKCLQMIVRFDIILLTGEKGSFKLEHIKNAFSAWD